MAVKRPRKAPKTAAQLGIQSKSSKVAKRMLRGGAPPVAHAALRADKPGHTKKATRFGHGSARVIGSAGQVIKSADSDPRTTGGAKKGSGPHHGTAYKIPKKSARKKRY